MGTDSVIAEGSFTDMWRSLSCAVSDGRISPLVAGAIHLAKAMMWGDSSSKTGTLYIIAVNGEFVKIGFTKFQDARARVGEIQKGCPYPFEVVLETDGGRPLEQALHAIFKDYRLRDEWFRYTGELRVFCETLKPLVATRSGKPAYPTKGDGVAGGE
jgi:hypothetical protein